VIDLKVEDFKPEFTSKMSFYLTAVDELERQPGDEPRAPRPTRASQRAVRHRRGSQHRVRR
jgi:hypothetical protein